MSYWGLNFFGVIKHFFYTFASFIAGNCSIENLAIDEIQVLVLVFIGISCALIGSFLVLRKMTMLANSISHTILIGIVIAHVILQWFFFKDIEKPFQIDMQLLMLASFISSLLTLFLTDFFNRVLKLQKDASIGLVFTVLFAIGIVLVTIFTRNSHIGSEIIMGNIDMVHKDDLKIALFLLLSNVLLTVVFFKEYLITSFDSNFAKLSKISNWAFTYLLLLQTSATVIGALRAVGVVLVLALIVIPPLTARLYTNRLRSMILLACLTSALGAIIAVALSRHFLSVYGLPLSTAGLVVVCQFFIWGASVLFAPKKGVLAKYFFNAVSRVTAANPS